MDEKTENLWRILDTNLAWIRYSDAKATGILSVYGLIITFSISNIFNILDNISHNSFLVALALLAGLCSLGAIIYAFRSINPRLLVPERPSIVFFQAIVSHYPSVDSYRDGAYDILDAEEPGIDDELCRQIHINARIASRKFRDVAYSIRFFVSSILVLLIMMLTFLIMS